MARALSWLAALALVGSTACAGASLRDGVYRSDEVSYRIGVLPAGFRRVEVDGNDLAFHRRGAGTISVNSTCTDYEDVPLNALVNHLLFETTERRFAFERIESLDGRAAHHVLVEAELDGVPIELELYVMKKDGCVIDLAYIGPAGGPADAREAFRAFVARFALLEVHRNA